MSKDKDSKEKRKNQQGWEPVELLTYSGLDGSLVTDEQESKSTQKTNVVIQEKKNAGNSKGEKEEKHQQGQELMTLLTQPDYHLELADQCWARSEAEPEGAMKAELIKKADENYKAAFELFLGDESKQRNWKSNYAAERNTLGLLLLHGNKGAKRNQKQAAELFASVATQTVDRVAQAGAQNFLGLCCENGQGVTKNVEVAFRYYSLSYEQGSVEGEYNLARCYEQGIGTPKDVKKALELYKSSDTKGNKEAWKALAAHSLAGESIEKEKGLSTLTSLAEQGDAEARYYLARYYEDAKEIKRDTAKAMEYYRLAAEQGHTASQLKMADAYEQGQGVPKDLKEAARLYEQLILCNDPMVQNRVGEHLRRHPEPVDQKDKLTDKEAIAFQRAQRVAQAVACFQIAAQQGDAQAQFNLAACYQEGFGLDKDLRQSRHYYQQAAHQGHREAKAGLSACIRELVKDSIAPTELYDLGLCYQNGAGIEKDIKEAVRLYELAAAKGNLDAQYKLGQCYELGQGVEKDMSKAVRLYRSAAEYQHSEAQLSLGHWYERGIWGVIITNESYARSLYELAEKGGSREAKIKLAELHEKKGHNAIAQQYYVAASESGHAYASWKAATNYRLGVSDFENEPDADDEFDVWHETVVIKKNIPEAIKLLKRAAEQGSAEAQNDLAYCYQFGEGVDKDLKEAVRLYQCAAEQGNALAQSNLGICYEKGLGVKADIKEAVRLYKLADKKEIAEASCNLGRCYLEGEGVNKNPQEAMCLFQSIRDESPRAEFYMGYCYMMGLGAKKDLEVAITYFMYAADSKDEKALNALGYCYLNGIGVPQSETRAMKYFESAFKRGSIEALINKGHCLQFGRGTEVNLPEAIYCYRYAAGERNSDAQNRLAKCYEYGIGVNKNEKAAAHLYQLAAEQGHRDAQYNLARCYERAIGINKDIKQAVSLYEQLKEKKHSGAIDALGVCYQHGKGVEQDRNKAIECYRQSEYLDHNREAKYHLALYGSDKDEKIRIIKSLMEAGYVPAQYTWGEYIEQGEIEPKDMKEALRLFKLVAEVELQKITSREKYEAKAKAQNKLAGYYEAGRGIGQDKKKAWRLYRLSAEQGNPEAEKNLLRLSDELCNKWNAEAAWYFGVCRREGKGGLKKDLPAAVNLFQMSSDQGYAPAQNALGLCYLHGKGMKKDIKEAIKLFHLAAGQGDVDAQNNLGDYYLKSNQLGKAVDLYTLSSKQDSAVGQYHLAQCYAQGLGVLRLYKLAAEKNHPQAQWHLALHYLKSDIEADQKTAIRLLEWSAEQGNAQAKNILADCYKDGKYVVKDQKKAFQLYQSSAQKGNSEAQCKLGDYYAENQEVEENLKLAIMYYQLSAEQGNKDAKAKLSHLNSKDVEKPVPQTPLHLESSSPWPGFFSTSSTSSLSSSSASSASSASTSTSSASFITIVKTNK